MTIKKATKPGTATGKKKLTLKKETLSDLSPMDGPADQVRGGPPQPSYPTRKGVLNHNETLVRATSARNVRSNY